MLCVFQIESCSQFWFQPEEEMVKVYGFETYLRNYRKEVLKPISNPEHLTEGESVIVGVDECQGTTYHRAKIISANGTGVCLVSVEHSIN